MSVTRNRWQPLSAQCEELARRMAALLGDWGGFLEAPLYEEALIHFCGGQGHCLTRLPVYRDGIELGTHRIACHADGIGFVLTAFSREAEAHASQLGRLLHCLPLRGLQWLNLNHAELQLVTLTNERKG